MSSFANHFPKENKTISFESFEKIFTSILCENQCHEVLFSVDGSPKYTHCWMGVSNKDGKPAYWFGLTKDNSEAYDYDKFKDMKNAKVFDGKCLETIWDKVVILSFDGCSPEEIIPIHLNRLNNKPTLKE